MSTLHRTELEVKLKGLQELLELKKTIYEQVGAHLERAGIPWETRHFGDRSWISTPTGAWPGCCSQALVGPEELIPPLH